jgi:hypothetical protein
MATLTPELREKFFEFLAVYEFTKFKLESEGHSGGYIANEVWRAAQAAVPLAPDELKLYKKLVALHSVNGGDIFADDRLA